MSLDRPNEVDAALRACRSNFAMTAVFSLVINLLILSSPLYMMQIYDRVLAGRSYSTLLALTVLVMGLLIVMGILEVIRSRILVRVGTQIDNLLHKRVFQATIAQSLRSDGEGDGNALRDLREFREFLSGQGPLALFDTPWVPIYILVIFVIHPLLGTVALIGACLLFVFGLFNDRLTRAKLTLATHQARTSDQLVAASRRNAEALTAMGMLSGLQLRWQYMHRQALQQQSIASDRAGTVAALSKVIRIVLQVTILGFAATLVIEQDITAGGMIAASIIMGRALAPVEQAIGHWRGFTKAHASYRRLSELLNAFPGKPNPMRLALADTQLHVETLVAGPPGMAMPTIRGLDFSLSAGEALGVVGPSASGKSTLARLLVGVWQPRHGAIRLDGIALNNWHVDDLSAQIGYLPQNIELFDGRICDNIARFASNPDPEAIIAAAKTAGVHDMIVRLPQGYETPLGSGGCNLSGGQRQRIGLARALFGDPFLVVLDEPNASLDAFGDLALTEAIKQLKKRGQIVVVMAHRPSAIKACDKLLVLRGGRQAAFGSPKDILKADDSGGSANVTVLPSGTTCEVIAPRLNVVEKQAARSTVDTAHSA